MKERTGATVLMVYLPVPRPAWLSPYALSNSLPLTISTHTDPPQRGHIHVALIERLVPHSRVVIEGEEEDTIEGRRKMKWIHIHTQSHISPEI